MSRRLRISGEYAEDGKARRQNARAEAGHRCIRCGHPFETGKHGKGEWSPCDEQCTHNGPIRILYKDDCPRDGWTELDKSIRDAGVIARDGNTVEARWRILTVHHFDGNKSNDWWANCLVLCQRCHLQIQGRVNPDIPYFLEHSAWFRPYAAAYYAKKYLAQILTREEVMQRLDELLQLERLA